MFHTSSPLPQQRLSRTLSSLLLSLPPTLFLPFLTAFYKILTSQYAQLPSLRLDKYLYLLRRYVSASFDYLVRHTYPPTLVRGYLDLVAGDVGPLSCGRGEQARVPDGIRYHVLDFWVPELKAVLREREPAGRDQGELFMEPVRALEKNAKGKVVRRRAREAVKEWEDESKGDAGVDSDSDHGSADHGSAEHGLPKPSEPISDQEWEGFGD